MAPAPSQDPTTSEFGEEVASFLAKLHIFSSLEVIIMSGDGWSWALAWAQLSVKEVHCCPILVRAMSQLQEMICTQGSLVSFKMVSSLDHAMCQGRLISFHQGANGDSCPLQSVLWQLPPTLGILFTADVSCLDEIELTLDYDVVELQHWQLGGLTTTRLCVGWSPLSC